MKQKRNVVLLALGLAAIVGGCGGGGGGSSSPQSGVFIDAPVSGLAYRTESSSGVTDANGRFSYLAGETVTFLVGSLELGSAAGKAEISLIDITDVESLPINEVNLTRSLYSNALPGPMNRLINIAVLLQSLDADANASNGIEISEPVASRFSVDTVNLDHFYYDFADNGNVRNGLGLRSILREAATDGELTARPARNPALALQHFYAEMSAQTGIWQAGTSLRDANGDGIFERRYEAVYDASGLLLRDQTDLDGDGTFDRSSEQQVGSNLEILLSARDDDNDGTNDSETRHLYNDVGVLLSKQTTDVNDVVTGLETLEFDEQGRLIRREQGAGRNNIIQFWTVDELGMRSTYEVDSDADGQIETRTTLTFDGNIRSDWWVYRENDTNLDGMANSIQTRVLDAAGRILTSTRDDNLDGLLDYRSEARFDEQGRRISLMIDNDGGGFDYEHYSIYAADGLSASSETDQDGDGIIDRRDRTTYNADGSVLTREVDSDQDGLFEAVTSYSYTAGGQPAGYFEQNNGVKEYEVTNEYDTTGRLIRQEVDENGDGIADDVTVWESFVLVGFAAIL